MEKARAMTRRRMLQLTGVGTAVASAALAGCSATEDTKEVTETGSSPEPTLASLTVYDPTGSVEITQTFAPRLDTLEGKTIALVSNDAWQYDRTFPVIQQMFAEKYPSTTILNYDNFIHSTDNLTKDDNGLATQIREAGADAVVFGNAG